VSSQIRIQSDGLGKDTIVTLPDGTQLHPKSAIIWLDAAEANRVDMSFIYTGTDIHADIENVTMICPLCGHSHSHLCQGKL
jgi:hypothetical protein